MAKRTDTDIVVQALAILGGVAHLSDIYAEVTALSGGRIANPTVRGRLEDHSSDSRVWQNSSNRKPNLFFRDFDAGKGWWGLRNYQPEAKIEEIEEQQSEDALVEASEGRIRPHLRMERERSRGLVRLFKKQLSEFKCCVCRFDFFETYGDIGAKFIEAHHVVPVAKLKPGSRTKTSDLIAVCSNCHRMLHRNGLIDWRILRDRVRRLSKEKSE